MELRKLTDFELSGQRIELFFDNEDEVGMKINKGKFNAWLDYDSRLEVPFPVYPHAVTGEPVEEKEVKLSIQQYWEELDRSDIMKDMEDFLKYLETNEKLKP